jgi:uncharacterized protein
MDTQRITATIARELGVRDNQVAATVALLDDGATVPFIARYRKEATGGLDDTQLRNLQERLEYLRELEQRREVVLRSIAEQGKLSDELKDAVLAADTKTRLEDLYRPYMPKRRSKAQLAREAGLEPLALSLLQNPEQDPQTIATKFIAADKGVADGAAALEGARQILLEVFADDAELTGELRELVWGSAKLQSKVVADKAAQGAKFSDYFDAQEALKSLPSHRALALLRGRTEGVLQLALVVDEADTLNLPIADSVRFQQRVAQRFQVGDRGRPADKWLLDTVRLAWRGKISTRLETDLKDRLREAAEREAINVFAHNLHDLLMAAPAGPKTTLGLDPGFRTGVKVAVVDATGKLLETATVYPHEPQKRWDEAIAILAALCAKHAVQLISIGNGTASRETDRLATDLLKRHPDIKAHKIVVSEAGASVYSASQLAADEFPDVDVSLRGAVSIARRLQDPLAELVKIDPKSIGVGQYQHDVNQVRLAQSLGAVVEDCVNAVGVDVNTASAPLLSRISGLNGGLARNIVSFRDEHGAFHSRDQLKKVPRLGEKAFQQAAGFLRIVGGVNPLDASAVHPEAYPVVQRISANTGRDVRQLIGDAAFLRALPVAEYTDTTFGEPTVRDILKELEKPGRDPRPEFRTAHFQEGVENIGDLKPGMLLEGVVTNVTNFGAFVDVGVHQDGLVHISALADSYVSDPRSVVKAGQIVKVKVLEVDLARKRIGLTMRLRDTPAPKPERRSETAGGGARKEKQQGSGKGARSEAAAPSALALALAKARDQQNPGDKSKR